MKKGVTPILATVLLLMITLAAAGAAYVWFMTTQERLQNQTFNGMFINFQIVSCTVPSSTSIIFQVRNLGDPINSGDWLALVEEKTAIASVSQMAKDSVKTMTFEFNETLPSGTFSVTLNSPGGGEKTTLCS